MRPSKAWFPPEPGDEKSFPSIDFVKPEVYRKGNKGQQEDEEARAFLEYIGVRSLDERGLIEQKLERYNDSTKVDKQHISELKQFIRFWKKNRDENIFKDYRFLWGVKDGESSWCSPQELCLDVPYETTGLAEVTDIHDRYVVWEGYKEDLSESRLQDFPDFLRELGVMKGLAVTKTNNIKDNPNWGTLSHGWGYKKATNTKTVEDYSIPHIKKYLSRKSVTASHLVWNALIHAERKSAKARYSPNQQYTPKEADSQLVHYCKNYAWIPTKSREFRKPAEMTRDELRDDFPYDDRSGLLTAIGFGKKAKEDNEEYQERNRQAQSWGFESADDAKKVAEMMDEHGLSADDIVSLVQKRAPVSSPPRRPVFDLDRLEERMIEQIGEAPAKEYIRLMRSTRKNRNTIDPNTWLREVYTHNDNLMYCQICREEMPFRKRDNHNQHYFEAIEILSRHYLPNEIGSQYLALCPLCSAKYREFVTHTRKSTPEMDKLKKAIIDARMGEESVQVHVDLDKKAHISFTETHHCSLKIILMESSGNNEGQAGQ